MVKSLFLFLSVAVLSLSGCGENKREKGTTLSQMQGSWMEQDIEQALASKNKNKICEYWEDKEVGEGDRKVVTKVFSLKGIVIDYMGNVMNLTPFGAGTEAMFKVDPRGEVYEDRSVEMNDKLTDLGTLIDHELKFEAPHLLRDTMYFESNGKEKSEVAFYVRIDSLQYSKIQTLLKNCN